MHGGGGEVVYLTIEILTQVEEIGEIVVNHLSSPFPPQASSAGTRIASLLHYCIHSSNVAKKQAVTNDCAFCFLCPNLLDKQTYLAEAI